MQDRTRWWEGDLLLVAWAATWVLLRAAVGLLQRLDHENVDGLHVMGITDTAPMPATQREGTAPSSEYIVYREWSLAVLIGQREKYSVNRYAQRWPLNIASGR